MTKVMKIAGMKKKKIEVSSAPAKKMERIDEFRSSTVILDNKIYDIIKESGHLIFLDECIFKHRDFLKKAWSRPYENIFLEDSTSHQPC